MPTKKILTKLPWGFMLNYKRLTTPYRKLNDKKKVIFVHIPKNGGTSVVLSLFEKKIKHRRIIDFKIHNKKKFINYFKFCFVRNPWDRMVSAFFFVKGGGANFIDKIWGECFLNDYSTFESFVSNLTNKKKFKKISQWHYFQPQYNFISIDNKVVMDFVGRFENLNEDFEYVKNKLKIDCQLIHTNKSKRGRDYRKYYNSRTKKIVEDLYKKDIELFKYRF